MLASHETKIPLCIDSDLNGRRRHSTFASLPLRIHQQSNTKVEQAAKTRKGLPSRQAQDDRSPQSGLGYNVLHVFVPVLEEEIAALELPCLLITGQCSKQFIRLAWMAVGGWLRAAVCEPRASIPMSRRLAALRRMYGLGRI